MKTIEVYRDEKSSVQPNQFTVALRSNTHIWVLQRTVIVPYLYDLPFTHLEKVRLF